MIVINYEDNDNYQNYKDDFGDNIMMTIDDHTHDQSNVILMIFINYKVD